MSNTPNKLQKVKDFLYWELINRLKGQNVSVVCIMLMNEKGQVLAQTAQKNNIIGTNDTQYVFPGGKVETKFGEQPFQAVHREMKEETNLNVDIIKKLGKTRNNKYELHWYLCVPMDLSQLRVNEPGKQKELKFVDIYDSSVNWTPGNQLALDKFRKQLESFMTGTLNVKTK